MKLLLSPIVVLLLLLASLPGCSKTPPASATYIGDTNELSTLTTPNNFTVSPTAANEIRILRNGNNIAVHHIYYEGDSYYICDGFLGSKDRKAITQGLRINGTTGETYNRETRNWEPRPK